MKRDPYRMIHKVLRHRLGEVASLLGSTDFSDPEAVAALDKRFNGLATFLEHHAHEEDQVIHPLVPPAMASVLARIERDHVELENELGELKESFRALAAGDAPDQLAHGFYLRFQRFVADHLIHMHAEETVLLPAMQRYCTGEDFDAIARADYGSETAEGIGPMLRGMLPLLNQGDLVAMFGEARRVVTPEVFAALGEVVSAAISPQSWSRIERLTDREHIDERAAAQGAEPPVRRLVLLRHGKSAWDTETATDHARPLSKRGRRDAPRIGARIAELGWSPERVISSDSQRTRETWVRMQEHFESADIDFTRRLYHAEIDAVRELVARVPDAVRTLMLIGHNPGWENVLESLASENRSLTTCNAAMLTIEADTWGDAIAMDGCWDLEHLLRPKEL